MTPTQDQVLTASLKLIVDEFTNLGYEENIIFGKVNLILQGFITAEGTFTDEYIALAQQALDRRATAEFHRSLTTDVPQGIIMPSTTGIGGGLKP